jgi:hypothetical protein
MIGELMIIKNHCHICKECITKDQKKVRDHCHITGKFRGAAHAKCNINYFANRFLPVIFHNLKGYDGHLIIRKAKEMMDEMGIERISAIPNSSEKYMSFSIGNLRFIDSFQFMGSSLDKLVSYLYDKNDKYKHFKFMKTYYGNHMDLLCRKEFIHMNGLNQ